MTQTFPIEPLVLAPGGYRPRSSIYHVEPGYSLRMIQGRMKKVDAHGLELADLGAPPRLPAGLPVMPRQLVQGRTVGSGWIVYTDYTNLGAPVKTFKTSWTVPPAPTAHSGQLLFLFNGIQNSSQILQPVLQWGSSHAGGGNFWSVGSWQVGGRQGQAFHSKLVKVHPGDRLTGVIKLLEQSAAGFSYHCSFAGIDDTELDTQTEEELTWCVETLEAYRITGSDDYPNTESTRFSEITLQRTDGVKPLLEWQDVDRVTDLGQDAEVVSQSNPGGVVDIHYRD